MAALPFVRKHNGGRRMAAAGVLQWIVAAAAAGDRRQQVYQAREHVQQCLSATCSSGEKLRLSHFIYRGLRVNCARVSCEMGPPNPTVVGSPTRRGDEDGEADHTVNA